MRCVLQVIESIGLAHIPCACINNNTLSCFRHTPVVIEWKKSSRDKSNLQATYDAPIQLAAYMGAVNNDISYDFKVNKTQFFVYKSGALLLLFLLGAKTFHNSIPPLFNNRNQTECKKCNFELLKV